MTKNVTHARRANHDKMLTKTAKKDTNKHIFKDCSQPKSAVKNNTESRFSVSVTKNSTHAHKLIKTHNSQKELQKSLKRSPGKRCPHLPNAVKNNIKSKFSPCVTNT